MNAFLATIGFMGAIMLAMAVGVIFRGKALKGSCGGVGGADCLCAAEGQPMGSCDLPEDAPESAHVGPQVYRPRA